MFSRIRTEYGKIRSISPYSVRIRENAEQNNSEDGHFFRSASVTLTIYEDDSHFQKHYKQMITSILRMVCIFNIVA